MTTPLTLANRSILIVQIATLDLQINKLVKLINAGSFKTGSLMLAGKSSFGKEFNELITWRDQVPLPKQVLKDFLQHYCNSLMYQRSNCALILESGVTDFHDQTVMQKCNTCCRQTLQRNYFIVSGSDGIIIPAPLRTWICNECESIIKL